MENRSSRFCGVAPANPHELLEIDSGFGAVARKVVIHQARVEQIDSRRNRRVRGENVARTRRFERLFEAELVVAHQKPHLLERQKCRVALIHVEHGGLPPHRFESAHAADAKHNLLADAFIDIAAVKRIGDIAILRQNIFRDIRIEQIQRGASHVQFPNLDEDVARWQAHRDLEILPVRLLHRRQRQGIEIV